MSGAALDRELPRRGAARGLAAACAAGFLWGTGALVVNLLVQRHGQSPENISFWRFFVGALALVLLFGRKAAVWRSLLPRAPLLLLCGACMALYVTFWFLAIARIGAAVPTLISLCLPPVLVTLLAVARGREQLDLMLSLWLVSALAGTVLVVARLLPIPRRWSSAWRSRSARRCSTPGSRSSVAVSRARSVPGRRRWR